MKVAAGQTGTDSQGEPGVKEGRWGGGSCFWRREKFDFVEKVG